MSEEMEMNLRQALADTIVREISYREFLEVLGKRT